jgi:hypothetical protein
MCGKNKNVQKQMYKTAPWGSRQSDRQVLSKLMSMLSQLRDNESLEFYAFDMPGTQYRFTVTREPRPLPEPFDKNYAIEQYEYENRAPGAPRRPVARINCRELECVETEVSSNFRKLYLPYR